MLNILTNTASMTASRTLNKNQQALAQSFQRLSTGLRINSAKDDPSGITGETFKSVTVEGSYLTVEEARSSGEGAQKVEACRAKPNVTSGMLALVSRDYGMVDRDEAPQYAPHLVEKDRTGEP